MTAKEDLNLPDFWKWAHSRQDARQWSEDELACAELAWRAAIDTYDKHLQQFVASVVGAIDNELGDKLGS